MDNLVTIVCWNAFSVPELLNSKLFRNNLSILINPLTALSKKQKRIESNSLAPVHPLVPSLPAGPFLPGLPFWPQGLSSVGVSQGITVSTEQSQLHWLRQTSLQDSILWRRCSLQRVSNRCCRELNLTMHVIWPISYDRHFWMV